MRIHAFRVAAAVLFAAIAAIATAGCDREPGSSRQPAANGDAMAGGMAIRSAAFDDGQPIPVKYTQDGMNLSPPLQWDNLPAGTRELAMIVDDPDAPRPQPWVHWVIYRIPADAGGLGEGVPHGPDVSRVPGAVQGMNSGGKQGYDGPRPPEGHGVHHYYFKLMALDAKLDVEPGLTKEGLLKAADGHILGEAELVGTYER